MQDGAPTGDFHPQRPAHARRGFRDALTLACVATVVAATVVYVATQIGRAGEGPAWAELLANRCLDGGKSQQP